MTQIELRDLMHIRFRGLRVMKLNQNLDELTAKRQVRISALLERLRPNIS